MKIIMRFLLNTVLTVLLIGWGVYAPVTQAADINTAFFLNDRAADIIGAAPLRIPGLLLPWGISGKGVIVALADSGLDKGSISDIHPDLASVSGQMPKIVYLNSYGGRDAADDPVGHGTHMAAAIAGSGQSSQGKYKGVAPAASIYFQALLDQEGNLQIPEQLNSLFMPAYEAGVRIHVNGWGGGANAYGAYAAQADGFVNSYPDFLPIFSAGNEGPGAATLSTAANSKNALTVGSSQIPRPVFSKDARDAGQPVYSSSSGPAAGQRIKPDLLAPGSAVISARSSLVASNFHANDSYLRMGGTSMAAAVAGGAAALLYEYLRDVQNIKTPGSALMKAVLINGAKIPDSGLTEQTGFGVLDLTASILALNENSFKIAPILRDLNPGEIFEYRMNVTDTARPLKATLAWVDPASPELETGSLLINDLNLIVQAPDGREYYGNDRKKEGVHDHNNNVEQVVIDQPATGEYKFIVSGAGLNKLVYADKMALVYGQPLRNGTVLSQTANQITLTDGSAIDLVSYTTRYNNLNNTDIKAGPATSGSQLYQGAKTIYIFNRSWLGEGVQILKDEQQDLLVEMNPANREGGYYLDSGRGWPGDDTLLNNERVDALDDIPNGTEIKAWVNPSSQTIWEFQSAYREIEGIIESVDTENKSLKLLQDDNTYVWKSEMSLGWVNQFVSLADEDSPFGAIESMRLEKLRPSMKVTMMLAADSDTVQHIKIHRYLAMGVLASVDTEKNLLQLADGQTFAILPGVSVAIDGNAAELGDLPFGCRVTLLFLEQDSPVIQIQAYTQVIYGKIIYESGENNQCYLLDNKNQFQTLTKGADMEIYRDGLEAGGKIDSGTWVRAILNPENQEITRLDLGNSAHESYVKYFRYYDDVNQELVMDDGSKYKINAITNLNKNGFLIEPELLVEDEKINIDTVFGKGVEEEILVYGQALNSDSANITLEATAALLNGALIVQGRAYGGDTIYIYHGDGSKHTLKVSKDDSFSVLLSPEQPEEKIKVIAFDSFSGALTGADVKINEITPGDLKKSFIDVLNSPARESIENLATLGVVSGYEDGAFKPDITVSRAEFITMLGRALQWRLNPGEDLMYFSDNSEIPLWALEYVYYGQRLGYISGFSDGSLRPQININRSQAVVMLDKILRETPEPELSPEVREEIPNMYSFSYADQQEIPGWAVSSALKVRRLGITGFWGDIFRPNRNLTRAEAAVIIDEMIKNMTPAQTDALTVEENDDHQLPLAENIEGSSEENKNPPFVAMEATEGNSTSSPSE
ncbi:MAG: S8 family serine peptidase [Syntrophomonadaceae bacterium]|jgi:hypothetical protein|nr:S8 family serine peptidase [Syntrophomonadaceae bacterium]